MSDYPEDRRCGYYENGQVCPLVAEHEGDHQLTDPGGTDQFFDEYGNLRATRIPTPPAPTFTEHPKSQEPEK